MCAVVTSAGSGTVVWWAAPIAPSDAAGLVALLDPHERERLEHFRRPADKGRYLAAHALARLVLADAVGRTADALAFDRTCRCGKQHGKPVLVDGPGFSLSHSGDVVGVAVHPAGPVGLDVEQVREMTDLASMAAHVCSPAESAPDAATFFALWTRKEAVLKVTGDGLAVPMAAITLAPSGVLEWAGRGAPTGPLWLLDLHPVHGYRAALAGFGDAPPPVREADGDAVLASGAT